MVLAPGDPNDPGIRTLQKSISTTSYINKETHTSHNVMVFLDETKNQRK